MKLKQRTVFCSLSINPLRTLHINTFIALPVGAGRGEENVLTV